MKKSCKKGVSLLILAVLILTLLTGCFNKSTDDFYSLPELSEEYVQLQREIDGIMNAGAEYSAPTSGSYRQAVQFEDLDSDGEKEALVFFTVPGDDLPLKVAIFENDGQTYNRAGVIEGTGTDIKSIEYADMDNDGMQEAIVGWQIAPGMSMLAGYSLNDYQIVQLFSCDYTAYTSCSITGNGTNIAVIGSMSSENQGEATVYSLVDGEVESCTARLSAGVSAVLNLRSGTLSDGKKGLFVDSAIDESSLVTDILAYADGQLFNASMRSASGISQGTVRTYNIMASDIDSDGITEVPNPVQLPSQSDTGNYWLVEWNAFDSSGNKVLKETTYHNYSDGWYLELPKSWAGRISVRRVAAVSGERELIFSYMNRNGETVDFLAIYALSGDNREERSALSGRSVITERSSVIYAQELLINTKTIPIPVREDMIRDGFHLIYSELNT